MFFSVIAGRVCICHTRGSKNAWNRRIDGWNSGARPTVTILFLPRRSVTTMENDYLNSHETRKYTFSCMNKIRCLPIELESCNCNNDTDRYSTFWRIKGLIDLRCLWNIAFKVWKWKNDKKTGLFGAKYVYCSNQELMNVRYTMYILLI